MPVDASAPLAQGSVFKPEARSRERSRPRKDQREPRRASSSGQAQDCGPGASQCRPHCWPSP